MTVIPTARKCAAWACDRPSRRNGFFCSDACRARTWRKNHPDYVPPPGESARQNAAERPSRVSNGGPQVSFHKAVGLVTERFASSPVFVEKRLAERLAFEALRDALPARQRGRVQ